MSTNQYLLPTGRAGESTLPVMEAQAFEALLTLVRNHQRDADRLRILRNQLVSYRFLSTQAAALIKEIAFQDAKADAAETLYTGIADQDQFEAKVLEALQFEEQRQAVRAKVGLSAATTGNQVAAAVPRAPTKPAVSKSEASWMQRKPPGSDDDSD